MTEAWSRTTDRRFRGTARVNPVSRIGGRTAGAPHFDRRVESSLELGREGGGLGSRGQPSGREFRTHFVVIVSIYGIASALSVSLYLVLLLRMPADQVKGLAVIAGMLCLPAMLISTWIYRWSVGSVVDWLDNERSGVVSHEMRRRAFETVVNLPGRVVVLGFGFFVVPASLSVFGLLALFEEFAPHHALLMLTAIVCVAALLSIIEGFALKRWLATLRGDLTLALHDPLQRSELTRPISLVVKLQAVISVCTLVPVILTALVAHTRSAAPVQELVQSLQRELVDDALAVYRDYGESGLGRLDDHDLVQALGASVLVLDRKSGLIVRGESGRLNKREHKRIRASHEESGARDPLRGENLYVWQNTPDGRYAVIVSTPRSSLVGDQQEPLIVFLGLFAACLALALVVGWLVARDLGGATQRLGEAANRMASGDLRRIDVFESEDELGTLARAFDGMVSSLRASVGEVAETADSIDEGAGKIAEVARGLHAAAEGQGRDVKQVVEAMAAVEGQASEIASSSNELRYLVEESTSCVLELGASGDQLNQTAGCLTDRVEEVSTTVEQTIRSVRQVGRETEALVEASADTSSGMEEMASAMRHVDATAAETASLSEQVVAASELGQSKVRATIEGIESIRSATATAQSVILRLGSRAQEIGGILDVIDNVGDETNLLALNAAIIAAQAGDHGRAFSVVAGEIKELANRVLASTKEISALIHSVQQESQSAIDAMEEGSRSVAEGVARSSEAGKSLEEITRISRDSGRRIREIVESVQEQAKAAGQVVVLMDRVGTGVRAIQQATEEQERGNELVLEATQSMREVAQQVHMTTAEQASGLARIRESVSGVGDQMQSINGALQAQSAACNQVVGFLEEVSSRSTANERAARLMGESTGELSEQALRLRAAMGRFQR